MTDSDFTAWNTAATRQELDTAIDTFETFTDEDTYPSVLAAYPDPVERTRIAQRLYDLASAIESLALAIWP